MTGTRRIALASAAVLALGLAALPATALALEPTQWVVDGLLKPLFNGLVAVVAEAMGDYVAGDALFEPLESLLGEGTTLYRVIEALNERVVTPVAASLLSCVMLLRIIRVAERVDGSSAIPVIREVGIAVAHFAICVFLVRNSSGVCHAVYEGFRDLASSINGQVGTAAFEVGVEGIGDDVAIDVAALGPMVVTALICLVGASAARVVATVMVYARAIQLYAYVLFSPIPLALLGAEETRSMGVGFARNFTALALAGAIMAFVLACYPLVVGVIVGDLTLPGGQGMAPAFQAWAAKAVAMQLLLCFSLARSGRWARDILGG